jgi:hypothetical protein
MKHGLEPAIARRIAEIEQLLADLEARLPAHSVPPAMIMEMEALEEELERLRRESEKLGR